MRSPDHAASLRKIGFAALVLALVAITIAIYWPGMHGPVLLDDTSNLWPVSGWLNGQYDWRFVVFGNRSGPLHRPVSMATFLLDVMATHSTSSFAFKPTNLLIHILCGLAMLWLALQVFRRWPATHPHAHWAALVLALAWLWLPLNVDTVLYIIQRMAQLAALFMLLALGCYMTAREQIGRGLRRGQLLLWIGVPALTGLAALSKENGILALPLALVLEWFLYREEEVRRPASIKLFFVLTVGLPVLGAVTFVALNPGFILAGYAARHFTLAERLLTEPRILWCYVQTLLVPLGQHMGFFQDNFPVSTGPLQPWTTLPAITAWIALAITAWAWRKGNPLFAAGVFFFLVGQSLESGPISLELYFEHRNYLPSFGVLLALAGLLVWLWKHVRAPTRIFRRTSIGLLACVLGLYGAATWGHVQSWRNDRTFFIAQNVFNPTSPRFQAYVVAAALNHHNLEAALTHINLAERYGASNLRATETLWRFLAYCSAKKSPPAKLYDQLQRRASGYITVPTQQAIGYLADNAQAGCPDIDVPRLTAILEHWLDTTPTPARSRTVWQARYDLGRIIATSGRLRAARDIVQRSWVDSGYRSEIGILLFELNGSLGDVDACRAVLARLEQYRGNDSIRVAQAIATFRKALATGEISAPPSSPNQDKP